MANLKTKIKNSEEKSVNDADNSANKTIENPINRLIRLHKELSSSK